MTRAPREEQVFSHLQLVPVSDRRLLLVIVTRGGAVRQTVIDTVSRIAPDALYTVSQIISRELEGCAMNHPRGSPVWPAVGRRCASCVGLLAAQPPRKGRRGGLAGGRRALEPAELPEYAVWIARRSCSACLERGKRSSPSSPIRGDGNLRSYRPETGMEENAEGLLHRHGELSLKRRNKSTRSADRPDPDAIRHGVVVGAGRGWPLDQGELLDGQNENHEKQEQEKIRAKKRSRSFTERIARPPEALRKGRRA